jgi:hypothetical protein
MWPTREGINWKKWLQSRNEIAKSQRKDAKQPFKNAVKAAEKALIYRPTATFILNLLAQIYIETDWTKRRVSEMLRKSHAIDPDNLETLQLAGQCNINV